VSPGEIVRVLVDALSAESTEKPKSTVQWVPSHFNVPAVVRLYDHLFMMEDPPDADWEKALNPSSLLVKESALVDPSLFKWGTTPQTHFQVTTIGVLPLAEHPLQFERLGFFVVDRQSPMIPATIDSAADMPKVVFNLTVLLKVHLSLSLCSRSAQSTGLQT
jgi:hypothetical protein